MLNLPPTTLVIFGSSGNLSKHKLIPALYKLLKANQLPDHFAIVCIFRDTKQNVNNLFQEAEIQVLRDHMECDPEVMSKLKSMVQPLIIDSTNPADYSKLRDLLNAIDHQTGQIMDRLFYLAIPPTIFKTVVNCLGESGLNMPPDANHSSQILVEKPFGNDLASAQELINYLGRYFKESQIYRVDHYLAKETAQNILAFRFSNPIIEGIWSREFIDHIQITAAENVGIEWRVGYYETTGALRDIVQSHLLQMMALVMMEYPEGLSSASIHAEKLKLLSNILPVDASVINKLAVRGQYETYRQEVNNPQSMTETYAALKLEVHNQRWGGVPILLRSGKALAQKTTDIHVVFKDRIHRSLPANQLIINIQPNEGISLKLLAKKPGLENHLQIVDMNFDYKESFDGAAPPDAYQRVLVDTMRGDQSLFATGDEVLACWNVLQPVVNAWSQDKSNLQIYPTGSWGPPVSNAMAASYGYEWYNPGS